jgi:hypothetical protein
VNATRLCGAKFGILSLYDGVEFRNVAFHNVPPAYADIRLREPFRPHPKSGLAHVARTKLIVHTDDLRTKPPYLEGDPAVVAIADLAGARTIINMPMLKDIFRQEVQPFSDNQIELVSNFAKQAVIENARLFEEVQARTRELQESLEYQTATSDVLQSISVSLSQTCARICRASKAFAAISQERRTRPCAPTRLCGSDKTSTRYSSAKRASRSCDRREAPFPRRDRPEVHRR